MIDIQIRAGHVEDQPAIVAIARAAYAVYVPLIGKAPPPMVADFSRPIADGQVWVATIDRVVQAYLVAFSRDDHLFLENIGVCPGVQGAGLGRKLMQKTEHLAQAYGHARIELDTNVKMRGNIDWYLRLGFTETGRAAQEGMGRIFFTKYL